MDFAFKSAKEKLKREHRERKEKAKEKLEQERKAKDATSTQRQAIEASQRAKRIVAIEAIEASQRAKRIEADAARRQREAIEASQRARRIEAQMKKAKVKRKEVAKSKGGSLTDRMKALHLANSDEEKEDVESKGKKRCYQASPPLWYLLGGMRQEAKADGDSQGLSAVEKSHLPNSDEEEEDVKSRGGSLTKRKKMSYLTSPPWYYYYPRMRQEAKADWSSQGLSAVKKSPTGNSYDKEFMYDELPQACCYTYIRKHQEVAEKPNQQESAGELTPELQTASTSSDWYERKDEEDAPVAANGNCKMWNSMWKQKKKNEEDDWV